MCYTYKPKILPLCLPGVTLLAVGFGQSDTEELRRVVTDVLYTRDITQLDSRHTTLADLLCGIARSAEVRGNL